MAGPPALDAEQDVAVLPVVLEGVLPVQVPAIYASVLHGLQLLARARNVPHRFDFYSFLPRAITLCAIKTPHIAVRAMLVVNVP